MQQTSASASRRRNKQSQPHRPSGEEERGPPVGSSHRMECAGPSQPSGRQDQGTPLITYRRKALSTGPSATRQKDDGGASRKAALREISEGSDAETEDNPRISNGRHQQGNHAVDDEECGVDEDDVEEDKSDREREREDREESMQDSEGEESREYYEEDYRADGENDDAYAVDHDGGRQERSADVDVDDARGERSEASVLKASQEAVAESVKKRKGSASTRTTKGEKRPPKRKQMVDEGDSGEDAEGVPPRVVSEQSQPSASTHVEAIDTTRCFFLEFDEYGFAKKKREHIQVDVTKILPIPEGDILFNHRTLDETLVQSIYDAIHNAAKDTNGRWDFTTFILAPIVPNRDGSQGRRITPEQFDVELAHTYNWYVVAGQHTAEAINRLIQDKSPAEKVYGLRSYSHVRVVYFDDDTKRGYPYVSTFDNTREERSIPRSFSSSVRQIRTFWDKRNDRIRPPGTVSPNDVEGMKRKKKWEAFMNAACKMTPDSGLMISSLENDYCKEWTNKLRGYMNLAQCGDTVWPLVLRFFDMYEKGLLPRGDGVRYIDLSGKVEGRLPGQYFLKDNSGRKVLFHCIKRRKGSPGATVPRRLGGPDEIHGENGAGLEATEGMYKETPFHLKCFIYEAIDCLDDLRAEINRISSSARHIFWEAGKRITTILLFEIEPKGVLTDNEEVVGTTRGMKIRATILDMSTSPKCVPWDEDAFSKLYAFLMTCCGENWALIIFASMKHRKQVMQSVYSWDDVEVLKGSWYKHYTPWTTLNKYGNIAVRYTDMMAIVLHAESGNLDNITVAPKMRVELTTLNVEEGEFVRFSGECIGVEGDTNAVYSWMEREPARLQKLCSSFIREDDGVLLLGRAHAGLIWELAHVGHHVFACDDATKELKYVSKFLEFYVKDPRNKCRFEKPQVEHRKDRDIYYKLGRKREKVWAYLFGDAPQSAVDNDYVIKKSELEIAINEYHGLHMGDFHMFVACCEHLYFNMKKRALTSRDYADLARKTGNFNNIDCDEDTADSDVDVPSRAAQGAAEGARAEKPQGSTNADAEKARSGLGATRASEGNVEHRLNARGEQDGVPTNPVGASEGIVNSQGKTAEEKNECGMTPPIVGPSSTHAPQAEQHTFTLMDIDEEENMDMTALMPKLVPRKPLPQGFSQDPSVPYLLQDKYKESSEEDWGNHILWHEGVFEPCVFAGKWHMAVKTRDRGWVAKERKDVAIWHSVTETQLFRRVLQENVGASEVAVAAKAKGLFEHLRANKQLEFSTKFYDLASSVSYGSIDWKINQASAVQRIDSITSLKTQDVIASNMIVALARGEAACEMDTRENAGHMHIEQLRACLQQTTQRSTMGDSTMIRKDGDDMKSGTMSEQPMRGVNDGATIVGSFGSLVTTMTARQGVFEMMETDASEDDESQTVKVAQEEVGATTDETKKGEGSHEHISIIDMISESTREDMIQDNDQKDDHAAPQVEGGDEDDAQRPRRSTRAVITKTVFDA
ncbi:hypothetical protein CBR_g21186 [Chara braunii]|uniref:Uncharacterized protein n=1 Tax=Chara braunii TaxID=69332 RepID=A0A388L0U5_CHABU|nr:hypothetical protein CBR_g21186 [Chara braunii]|eukprot:GBG75944.1 hypothetical protein CBR_g21186 [Chara braunii]